MSEWKKKMVPKNKLNKSREFLREPQDSFRFVFHPGLFERNNRKESHCIDSDRPISCMAVNQFREEVLVGSTDHAAKKASPRKRLYTKDYGHFDWLSSCLYLHDTPITAGIDGKICIWDRSKSSTIKCQQLVGNQGSISSIKSLAENNIVSAGYDGSLCVWNLSSIDSHSFQKISNPKKALPPLSCFEVTSHGRALTCAKNGIVSIWDCSVGAIDKAVAGKHESAINSVVLLADGPGVYATGGSDGIVAIWDTRKKLGSKSKHRIGCTDQLKPHIIGKKRSSEQIAAQVNVLSVAYHPSSGTSPLPHLLSGGADGGVVLIDPRKSTEPVTKYARENSFPVASLCSPTAITSSACSHALLSGDAKGTVCCHDICTGSLKYAIGSNKGCARFIDAVGKSLIVSGDDGRAIVYPFS